MDASRPIDALNNARHKRVMVELKNGKRYIGKLMAFDIHINTVLDDAEEYTYKTEKKEVDGKTVAVKSDEMELNRKLGTIFIRGDTIILVTPQQ